MRTPASTILFPLIAAVMSTAGLAQPALAQAANYTSVEATSEKPVQLTYHASAHKNCTPGSLPTVRLIEPPKAGVLTVRRATLTTGKVAGCPDLKIPAQVAFYQARAGLRRDDHRQGTASDDPSGCEGSIAVRPATQAMLRQGSDEDR
jgi:hypothetical protein